jgi:outer membrane protein OmpA-like peptidoglycan-associated protein
VVDYLAAKGVAPARIHSVGYGDTRPVAPNNSEANRAKNRRIEFKVTKD